MIVDASLHLRDRGHVAPLSVPVNLCEHKIARRAPFYHANDYKAEKGSEWKMTSLDSFGMVGIFDFGDFCVHGPCRLVMQH